MATPAQVNAILNRLTALDGITSPVPSGAAVPTIEADLNGLHTTINQVTLTLQAQLNQVLQQVAVLQATVNEFLGGTPVTAPVNTPAVSGEALIGYDSNTGEFTQGSVATSSPVLSATITLSAAQVAALNTVPIQIVAAPGAGKAIMVTMGFFSYEFVTTPYGEGDFANAIKFGYPSQMSDGTTSMGGALVSGFMDQSVSYGAIAEAVQATQQPVSRANIENQPIQIGTRETNPITGGDGLVKVTILYTVVTL